jgi:hypothetical protein
LAKKNSVVTSLCHKIALFVLEFSQVSLDRCRYEQSVESLEPLWNARRHEVNQLSGIGSARDVAYSHVGRNLVGREAAIQEQAKLNTQQWILCHRQLKV